MKKIILGSLLLAAVSFSMTSCLKDKGFDNYEYGINDPDTQAPGVGFSFGTNAKNDFGLDVSTSPQTVGDLTNVNMLTGVVPTSDVNVTITNNTTTLLAAYNSANGTAILALPTALYTSPASIVVPAGQRFNNGTVVVSNTTSLDPNKQYAVGLTISAVTGGYNIAGNMKNLLIIFSVKNKYDGKYTMKGRFYHPSLQPDMGPHTFQVELHTAGPDDVRVYWPLVSGYNTPLTSGGGPACCFASQALAVSVNPTTNVATAYNSAAGGLTYELGLSTGAFGFPCPTPNRWDNTEKRLYLSWGYTLASGTLTPGASRMWIDTLTRTGPR